MLSPHVLAKHHIWFELVLGVVVMIILEEQSTFSIEVTSPELKM